MRDAADRLLQDLKWRLSPAGRRYRPSAQVIRSWGASEVPQLVPFLLWLAWFISSIFLALNLNLPGGWSTLLVPVSWLGAGLLISRWTRATNLRNITKAYRRVLSGNERFLLIEYTRYIRRKIRLAENDPVLGGPEEVRRLKQTHRKLRQILEKGRDADSGATVRSIIGDEADFAESLVEVYAGLEEPYDPLADLDARLPEEIRSRLDEFEEDNRRSEERRLERE
ncbi:hypothetical protein KDL44_15400 [bacterium]|nr:hypothetical protein [bacterium]